MDRTQLLLVILFVSLVIAGVVNFHYFTKRKPRHREVSAPILQRGGGVTVPEKKEATEAPLAALVKFEPIPVDTSLLKSQRASGQWGREPFLTPEELRPVAPVAKETAPKEEVPLPTVSSILISEDQRVATINGRLYSVGELITGTGDRVIAITNEGVLLERTGVKHLLQLRQSPVQVKSREK